MKVIVGRMMMAKTGHCSTGFIPLVPHTVHSYPQKQYVFPYRVVIMLGLERLSYLPKVTQLAVP